MHLELSIEGRKLGYYSDFAIYSFQAIKHLTTIDGGAISSKITPKIIIAQKN